MTITASLKIAAFVYPIHSVSESLPTRELTYTPGAGTAPTFFEVDESFGRGQTRLTDTSNQVNESRVLTFYVEGTALTAVPEPGSALMLGLGVIGLGLVRRKS